MNRRGFLQSIAALGVTAVLLKPGLSAALTPSIIEKMAPEDFRWIGYCFMGLPVVNDDGTRYMGEIPNGSELTCDTMLKGTEVAAYRFIRKAH
jgi:hypothetical protein